MGKPILLLGLPLLPLLLLFCPSFDGFIVALQRTTRTALRLCVFAAVGCPRSVVGLSRSRRHKAGLLRWDDERRPKGSTTGRVCLVHVWLRQGERLCGFSGLLFVSFFFFLSFFRSFCFADEAWGARCWKEGKEREGKGQKIRYLVFFWVGCDAFVGFDGVFVTGATSEATIFCTMSVCRL